MEKIGLRGAQVIDFKKMQTRLSTYPAPGDPSAVVVADRRTRCLVHWLIQVETLVSDPAPPAARPLLSSRACSESSGRPGRRR